MTLGTPSWVLVSVTLGFLLSGGLRCRTLTDYVRGTVVPGAFAQLIPCHTVGVLTLPGTCSLSLHL